MILTNFKVKAIIYPQGEYRFGAPVDIIDEGSFYRIDGTHIYDKHRIVNISFFSAEGEIKNTDDAKQVEKVVIEMKDKTVLLEVTI